MNHIEPQQRASFPSNECRPTLTITDKHQLYAALLWPTLEEKQQIYAKLSASNGSK